MSTFYTVLFLNCLIFLGFSLGQTSATILSCPCDGTLGTCNFTNRYSPEDGSKNKENVALGKPVNLSVATQKDPDQDSLSPKNTCLAVNGDRTVAQKSPAACISTDRYDNMPTFTLNLGSKYTISTIVIYALQLNEHHLINASIKVDSKLCYTFTIKQPTVFSFQCSTSLTGQIITVSKPKIQLSAMDSNYPLKFCEFEVWVCKPGFYGSNCEKSCENCKTGCNIQSGKCLTKECKIGFYGSDCSQKCGHCAGKICNFDSGFCPCEENWSGVKCDVNDLECSCEGTGRECIFKNRFQPLDGRKNRVNVAIGKEATVSSMVEWDGPEDSIYRESQGCLAVNGDRGAQLIHFWDDESTANCILTSTADENPTFTLNLGRRYSITNIVIFVRKDYEYSLIDATISVNDQQCHVIKIILVVAFNLQCYSPITGQIITLSRPSNYVLTFCELEVWVCRLGFYGSDCDIACETCQHGCEALSGKCLTTDCSKGLYGPNCDMSCENCINGCNSESGACTTADCKIGFYGNDCKTKCGYCRNRECDFDTGACQSGCEEHWLGAKCDQNDLPCSCPPTIGTCDFTNVYTNNQVNVALGKPVSLSTMKTTPGARPVDACQVVDGQRMLSECVELQRWDKHNSVNINLGRSYTISKMVIYSSDTDRLLTSSIQLDGIECSTITEVTPFVVNITCDTPLTGQHIYMYKSIVTSTPGKENSFLICEFEVWACRPAFYGKDCEHSCERCSAGCHALNGSCLTAECVKGFYGNYCNKTCGQCVNTSCNYYTGNCPSGCKMYWSGKKCDIQKCPDGYYGVDCSLKCGACKNVRCEVNGLCTNGCEDGFLGDNCTQVCPDGFHGANCLLKCGACMNVKCEANGTCTNGCIDGFVGANCTEVKIIHSPALLEKVVSKIGTQIGVGVVSAGVFIAFLLFLVFEYRNRKGMIPPPGLEASEVETRKVSRKSRGTHHHGPAPLQARVEGEGEEDGEQGWWGGEGWWEGDDGCLEGDEDLEEGEAEKGKEVEAGKGKEGEAGKGVGGEEGVDPGPRGLRSTEGRSGEIYYGSSQNAISRNSIISSTSI